MTVSVSEGQIAKIYIDAGNISRVMTGNSSDLTLIDPLIIRQMCHNAPPTAINTSVEFILKRAVWIYDYIYPHQWGM